jgi:lipopolysaccharide biosynthesis glycosyltransferase
MVRPVTSTLFCVNAGYAQHLAACLVSLLSNNSDRFFDIVVGFTGELGASEGKLRRSVERYGNLSLRLVPFAPPPAMDLPIRAHYSIDIYSRLWVDHFFPAEVERVLYLDADILVVGKIDELCDIDLKGNIVGAVSIPNSDRGAYLGIPAEYAYFNSGVMVFDLTAWRRERIGDRILDYVRANPERLIDPDQDALNACLYDRRLSLGYGWNVISPFFYDDHPLRIPASDRITAMRDARIIHFNGASKPWSYLCRHPRKDEYYAYLKDTEWGSFQPSDRNPINWLKRNIWHHLSSGIRDRAHADRMRRSVSTEAARQRLSPESVQ